MRVLQLLLDIKFVNWDEKVLHDGSRSMNGMPYLWRGTDA